MEMMISILHENEENENSQELGISTNSSSDKMNSISIVSQERCEGLSM